MEDTEVECYVDKGKAAPGFGHKGGVIQYRHYFTIHESTCLEYNEGLWKVYFFERGGKTNEKVSKDIDEACENILYEMAESKEEFEAMRSYYRNELDNRSADNYSSVDFYQALNDVK